MNSLDFSNLIDYAQHDYGEWDPGFEGDRRMVVFRFGPFQSSYSLPKRFKKRFYHQVFDLNVEDWNVNWTIPILSGFCIVHCDLSIRFQATLEYAQENMERLPDINNHIKTHYVGLIKDSTEKELLKAEDEDLISSGFEKVENCIENHINETLIEQGIQSRARCRFDPKFKEVAEDAQVLSSGHFQHDQMVLGFIRNSHELQNQKDKERYRQIREQEHSRIEHEEKLLEHSAQEKELALRKETQMTEKIKAEVEEDERRRRERHFSDERMLEERLKHQNRMNHMEVQNELQQTQENNKITDEIEGYVRRDIQLLVLKRQQALLKKEIEKISGDVMDVIKKGKREKLDGDPVATVIEKVKKNEGDEGD